MNQLQQQESLGEQGYKNPSYDKSLPPIERLGDFLGKYHVVLNGVKAHEPFVRFEEDGGGMCCQEHKIEIIDFVEKLISTERQKVIDEVRELVEEMKGIANNPDFYLETQEKLKFNAFAKDVNSHALTQILWEAKDKTLDDLLSALKELEQQ